jgi:glycosyltransferase involved in cell wall biosynthesis
MNLSVITVYKFGDIQELSETIASVQSQKSCVYEHLLVLSSAVEEYVRSSIPILNNTKLILNKDTSLYNAMNIGLDAVTGDAVIFLNGGDVFASDSSVSYILNEIGSFSCLLMRTNQRYMNDTYTRPSLRNLDSLKHSPAHQGFVATVNAIGDRRFDENRKISADHYWMLDLMSRHDYLLSEKVVSTFVLGGVSNAPSVKTVRYRFQESGFRRGVKELLKLLIRRIVGLRIYYFLLLNWKCDRN